jgi:hypothetical protein
MKSWCFGLVVAAAIAGTAMPAWAADASHPNINGASSDTYDVSVKHVLTSISPGDKLALYDVAFNYSFKGRDSVVIKGLGLVEPSGSFSYSANLPEIIFLSPDDHVELLRVNLVKTDVGMGSAAEEYVKDEMFSQNMRTGRWMPAGTFVTTAQNLIQHYYPQGYRLGGDDNTSRLYTGFRSLPIQDSQTRAYIGLLIEYPQPAGKNSPQIQPADELEFRVRYALRERPRLSDSYRYNDQVTASTSAAAGAFLDEVMHALAPPKAKTK